MLLGISPCFGQNVDTAALQLMQNSWDKLASLNIVSYRMTRIDTIIRENHFEVNRLKIDGTVKKNDYWHIRTDNNPEWLVRGDTLYKNIKPGISMVTFTTKWKRHELEACNIYNLLGVKRPVENKNVYTLEFVQGTEAGKYHVIHEILKIDYGSEEVQSKLRYNRYFIDKKSLLPVRRIQYGKRLENGKEAVDIYDFSAEINQSDPPIDIGSFFHTPPVREDDESEALAVGVEAPDFIATDARTGKILNLKTFKGKIIVLDFWYVSCMPCRTLMPKLQQLQHKFNKDKVVVVGVNVRDRTAKEIIQFLNEKQILYAQLYESGQFLALDYKLKAFPTTLVLDRTGKIKLVEIGLGDDTVSKIERVIKQEL